MTWRSYLPTEEVENTHTRRVVSRSRRQRPVVAWYRGEKRPWRSPMHNPAVVASARSDVPKNDLWMGAKLNATVCHMPEVTVGSAVHGNVS